MLDTLKIIFTTCRQIDYCSFLFLISRGVGFRDNPTYALDCAKLTNARFFRHNAERDHLKIELQKDFPVARFRVEHTIAGDIPVKIVKMDRHPQVPRTPNSRA